MRSILILFVMVLGSACTYTDEPVISPGIPWEIAQPEEVGLNRERLQDLDQSFKNGGLGPNERHDDREGWQPGF